MFYLNQLSRELRNAHYFRATNLYNLKIITLFAHILPCTTPVVFHTISCSRLVWRRRWMFQMLKTSCLKFTGASMTVHFQFQLSWIVAAAYLKWLANDWCSNTLWTYTHCRLLYIRS